MRVLLDEHLPVDLGPDLRGHDVDTVADRGWADVKNGELLRRMAGHYDVLITMDRSIEFQQPLSVFPFGVIVVRAASNRMLHLRPLVPAILGAGRGSARRCLTPGAERRTAVRASAPS